MAPEKEAGMDGEHYCDECGDLRDAPGICPACAEFDVIDRAQSEAASGTT
jgi:hypothetical protein